MKPEWFDRALAVHRIICAEGGWAPRSAEDMRFIALGIAGEAGELANLVKKDWRKNSVGAAERREKMIEELADIRMYTEVMAHIFGVDSDEITAAKLAIVEARPENQPKARRLLPGEQGQISVAVDLKDPICTWCGGAHLREDHCPECGSLDGHTAATCPTEG